MNRSTHPTASRVPYVMALGLGLLLGHGVALLAQQREGSLFACFIAVVFIASSSASFVLFVLSQRQGERGTTLTRRAYGLVGMIGLGLLMSMRSLELLVSF